MPRRPSHDDWPGREHQDRPTPPHESLEHLVQLFARRAAEDYFEDLKQAQIHGKLKAPPEPD